MLSWLRGAPELLTAIGRMVGLSWRAYPLALVGNILAQIIQGLIPAITAWITKSIFDLLAKGVQGQPASALWGGLVFLLAIQAGIAVLGSIMMNLSTYWTGELGRRLALNVQVLVYEKINSLSGLAPFENSEFHDTIQVAANKAQYGPSQIVVILMSLLRNTITVVTLFGILLSLGLIPIIGLIAMIVPLTYIELRMSRERFTLAKQTARNERQALHLRYVLWSLEYAKEVRLFNTSGLFINMFMRITRRINELQRKHEKRVLSWQLVLSTIANLVGAGVFIAIVYQAFTGQLSIGDIALYTTAITTVQFSFSSFIITLARLHEGILFERHFSNLMMMKDPLLPDDPVIPIPPLQRGIEIRNVSFRYGEQHPFVLHNANLFLPAGKCLALVGLNGAGKTTLVKLLLRFYDPTEGQIFWDGIDIRSFDPQDLRLHLGVVSQDFTHYELSVRENIGLGDVARIEDLKHVQAAAIKAGIDDRISALPRGYETMLSRWLSDDSTGVELSGGEWQKIAIARMFTRDADLLILDEPTAALDAQAEYALYNHFAELVEGRTTLLITHRFSTVRMADMIAVLEDGHFTEYGTHDELLSHGRTYTKLYRMQAERYQ